MKKMFVCFSLFLMMLMFSACGKSDLDVVEMNMSERTNVYFFGQNEKMYSTLACGEREKNYFLDGKSGDKTSFSLLTIVFQIDVDFANLNVIVSINENQFIEELEYISSVGGFVCDLQKSISGSEKIEIKYQNNTILLENLSKNFGVNSDKAIEIGCKEFKSEIEKLRNGGNFGGECYLKILDKMKNNFEDFFWCFTLIDENGNSFSAVISTVDGKILAKS